MVFTRLVISFALLAAPATSRAFRGDAPSNQEFLTEAELNAVLLEEVQSAFGSVSQRGRLNRIEAALSSMYAALPKNEHGKLGHTTVRYALHRLFVQRHGWYIKGLEPGGQHFNSSSPTGVLKEHASSHLEELFEKRLGTHGFSLHDTAVLAATLEHLIHNEAEGRLTKAYTAVSMEQQTSLNHDDAEKLLDMYMKFYLLSDLAQKLPDNEMAEVFPGWGETQKFVREVLKEMVPKGTALNFAKMTSVVEEVGERFGRFQDGECRQMKTKLIGLGDQGIGRVSLQNFYRSSLDGNTFEFQESPSYLKQLGVLDEHDNVIVPNYVGSHTNCIASSNLYSICCIDECESLMASMEREFASPEATPQQILPVVAQMSSSTVDAPRSLPTTLVDRLETAAQLHGGSVQLHGRLFAQWMHHAFPRECPFPHVSGTTAPVTPDEWLSENGNDGYATRTEMLHYANKEATGTATPDLHWIDHEELLVPVVKKRRAASTSQIVFFGLAALGLAFATKSVSPLDLVETALANLQGRDMAKHPGVLLPVHSGKSHML